MYAEKQESIDLYKDIESRIIATCIIKQDTFSEVVPEDFYFGTFGNMYRAMIDGIFDLDLGHHAKKYSYDTEWYYTALTSTATDDSRLVPDFIEMSVRRQEKVKRVREIERLEDLSIPIPTVRNLGSSFLSGKSLAAKCSASWKNKTKINLGKFHDLGSQIYSIDRSTVNLIAGRPGTGKTGFTWQLAEEIAREQDEKWLFFSAEMSAPLMVERMAKTYFYLNHPDGDIHACNQWFFECMRDEEFSEEIVEQMCPNMELLDVCGLTISTIRAFIKSAIEIHGEKMGTVVIDYVQLIVADGADDIEKQGSVARSLQTIAKEFNVRILALTQLNREAEGKEPQKNNIKASSTWEDIADEIWALWNRESIQEHSMVLTHLKSRQNGADGRSVLKKTGLYFESPTPEEMNEWRTIW